MDDYNSLPPTSTEGEGHTPYVPCAVHYEEADHLEYILRDVPTFARTVHPDIDVLHDMDTCEAIGWRIRGWSLISQSLALPASSSVGGSEL